MNFRHRHPTTISSWALPLVETLEAHGQDSERLLKEAGIDKNQLSNPDARIRIELELETIGEEYVVTLNANEIEPHPAEEAIDMAMAAIVKFAKMLLSEEITPLKVEFKRPKPRESEKFNQVFQSQVGYKKKTNRILFQLNEVNLKLPSANAEIARCNDGIVIEYLANFDKENISNRVHQTS
ncbi:MAG: AraC family transcriptional regulator [Proteobacteria bacterium]|nr:AraC family transcriptional regulator [Pseudomonadota bacterium]